MNACECGDGCERVSCANCGGMFARCETRRSLNLMLGAGVPEHAARFCSDCWKDEDPDGYHK